MKKSLIAILHIGFWGIYIFFLLLLIGIYFQGNVPENRLTHYVSVLFGLAIIPAASAFYPCYFLLFPNYLRRKKIALSIILGIFIAMIATILGGLTLYEIVGREENYTLSCFLPAIPIMMSIAILAEIVALLMQGFITWFEEIKLKESLQQKNHDMQLALVKAQLDPHFLFNTINNIDVLILKDAREASDYLNKLSDIMRFMLFETKTEEILLTKELEYINKYIELQKIRTANTDYVNYSITGMPNGQLIAPMVFIPFIENAFKHTNNKKMKDAIHIQLFFEKEKTRMVCANKFDPHRKVKQEKNGLGNDLIQKRLRLIYPEQHTLIITNQDNLYSVSLTIQHD